MSEWEAEVKMRRNGRLVKMERALGDSPESALYSVHNDFELWAQDETNMIRRARAGSAAIRAAGGSDE